MAIRRWFLLVTVIALGLQMSPCLALPRTDPSLVESSACEYVISLFMATVYTFFYVVLESPWLCSSRESMVKRCIHAGLTRQLETRRCSLFGMLSMPRPFVPFTITSWCVSVPMKPGMHGNLTTGGTILYESLPPLLYKAKFSWAKKKYIFFFIH